MSVLVIIALVAIIIGWFISCYFVAYSWTQIGLNDGDDVNLNLASKYLGYASLSSWVILLIIIILIILAIVILILLLIFASEVVIPVTQQAFTYGSKYLAASFSKNKKVPASFTMILWFFLIVAIILTLITGIYAGIAAYYINKGVYTDDSANAIKTSLKYCYYTALLSIIIIIIIFGIVFAKIYFGIQSRKAQKEKEEQIKKIVE